MYDRLGTLFLRFPLRRAVWHSEKRRRRYKDGMSKEDREWANEGAEEEKERGRRLKKIVRFFDEVALSFLMGIKHHPETV